MGFLICGVVVAADDEIGVEVTTGSGSSLKENDFLNLALSGDFGTGLSHCFRLYGDPTVEYMALDGSGLGFTFTLDCNLFSFRFGSLCGVNCLLLSTILNAGLSNEVDGF